MRVQAGTAVLERFQLEGVLTGFQGSQARQEAVARTRAGPRGVGGLLDNRVTEALGVLLLLERGASFCPRTGNSVMLF